MAIQTLFRLAFTAGNIYTPLTSIGTDLVDDMMDVDPNSVIGHKWKQQGMPRVELPPNCVLRADYQVESLPPNAFKLEGIYMRLTYGALGSSGAVIAQAPLLTPVDSGDGADITG